VILDVAGRGEVQVDFTPPFHVISIPERLREAVQPLVLPDLNSHGTLQLLPAPSANDVADATIGGLSLLPPFACAFMYSGWSGRIGTGAVGNLPAAGGGRTGSPHDCPVG
jgi:hypothetical protein